MQVRDRPNGVWLAFLRSFLLLSQFPLFCPRTSHLLCRGTSGTSRLLLQLRAESGVRSALSSESLGCVGSRLEAWLPSPYSKGSSGQSLWVLAAMEGRCSWPKGWGAWAPCEGGDRRLGEVQLLGQEEPPAPVLRSHQQKLEMPSTKHFLKGTLVLAKVVVTGNHVPVWSG